MRLKYLISFVLLALGMELFRSHESCFEHDDCSAMSELEVCGVPNFMNKLGVHNKWARTKFLHNTGDT